MPIQTFLDRPVFTPDQFSRTSLPESGGKLRLHGLTSLASSIGSKTEALKLGIEVILNRCLYRPVLWLIAWVALFALLVWRLPIRPDRSFTGIQGVWQFVDSTTIVSYSHSTVSVGIGKHLGPLKFLDISSGASRTIPLPEERNTSVQVDLEFKSPAELQSRNGIANLTFRGDYAVLETFENDQYSPTLFVLNWRSGELLYRRALAGFLYGSFADCIWFASHNDASSRDVELLSLPAFKTIPLKLSLDDLWNSQFETSFDGQNVGWLDGETLHISNLQSGKELLALDGVAAFTFATRSNQVGVLTLRADDGDRSHRFWRIYGAFSGRLLQEMKEEWTPASTLHVSELKFYGDDQTLAAFHIDALSGVSMHGTHYTNVRTWRLTSNRLEIYSPQGKDALVSVGDQGTFGSQHVRSGGFLTDLRTGARFPDRQQRWRWISHDSSIGAHPNPPGAIDRLASLIPRGRGFNLASFSTEGEESVWSVATGRRLLSSTHNNGLFEITDDERRIVAGSPPHIDVWMLPLRPPIQDAFLWSLCVPGVFVLSIIRRRLVPCDRNRREIAPAPSASPAPQTPCADSPPPPGN
jgi:hypothetical protein